MEFVLPHLPSSFSINSADIPRDNIESSLSLNPLYLHHGDSLGSHMVVQPLDGENYSAWSRSMIMALIAKNKLVFIDGSLPQPSVVDPTFRS